MLIGLSLRDIYFEVYFGMWLSLFLGWIALFSPASRRVVGGYSMRMRLFILCGAILTFMLTLLVLFFDMYWPE